MCGILGVVRSGRGFDSGEIQRGLAFAAESLSHRGPDAQGVALRPADGVAFAHRRLAILDLDPRADQPMSSEDGSLLIAFNGEIYNFRELRKELSGEGSRFRTESDTEVLLEGYRHWGMDRLLDKAAGMFAFALYDGRDKRLHLVRDRAGKKPLFYVRTPGGLAFASELRALLRLHPACKALDPAGLDAYLALKFVPSPRTLLQGVLKVPPGCRLVLGPGEAPRVLRYWHPYRRGLRLPGRAECLDRIESVWLASMRRRLVSDVPICLFLSGGIDSSLMAWALSRLGAEGMTAYTVGYSDLPAYNEFEHARAVARKFAIRHEELILDSREVLDALEDRSPGLDEPVSDWVWLPLHHLSRRAHQDGFKAVLLGEGSDELFIGYDVMLRGLRGLLRFGRLSSSETPAPREILPVSQAAWRAAAKIGTAVLAPLYRFSRKGHRRFDLLRRAAQGEPIYMGSSIGFGKSQRHQVAGPRLKPSGDPEAARAFIESLERDYASFSPDPADPLNLVSYIEFYAKMGEVLLQRVDRVTMLHSLEARSPFLDHDLVELAFSLPGDWKAPQGRLKGLLKEFARARLPEGIVDRKKMGFSFPFKEWLRAELGETVERSFRETRLFKDGWVDGEFCRDLLREHRSGWFDHAPRLWMLFDLCRWYDRWLA